MLVVEAAVGLTRTGAVSSKAEQTGGLGHGVTKVIVHRPPLVAPTVTRPLEDFAQALKDVADRRVAGRIVLVPNP